MHSTGAALDIHSAGAALDIHSTGAALDIALDKVLSKAIGTAPRPLSNQCRDVSRTSVEMAPEPAPKTIARTMPKMTPKPAPETTSGTL